MSTETGTITDANALLLFCGPGPDLVTITE